MKAKQQWIDAAIDASQNAYIPYSHFPVGACLVTADDELILGCNIENASFGLTNCAERTAIFKAISEGKTSFKHLVVYGKTDQPISPCGACRQVMVEFFDPEMPVTLVAQDLSIKEMTVQQLLPYSFTNLD